MFRRLGTVRAWHTLVLCASVLVIHGQTSRGQDVPPPEKSYVVAFKNDYGDVWGYEEYDTKEAAAKALERMRAGYEELGWEKLSAELEVAPDLFGVQPVKPKYTQPQLDADPRSPSRLAVLREGELRSDWGGLENESQTVLGLDKKAEEAREAADEAKAMFGASKTVESMSEDARGKVEEFDRGKARLEKRLNRFESRLRDFNSKKTKLDYAGTFDPPVVKLRKKHGFPAGARTTSATPIPTASATPQRSAKAFAGRSFRGSDGWIMKFNADGTALHYRGGSGLSAYFRWRYKVEGDKLLMKLVSTTFKNGKVVTSNYPFRVRGGFDAAGNPIYWGYKLAGQ